MVVEGGLVGGVVGGVLDGVVEGEGWLEVGCCNVVVVVDEDVVVVDEDVVVVDPVPTG